MENKIKNPGSFKKGHIPWHKGKHLPDWYKKILSDAHKGKKMHPNTRKSLLKANLGNKYTLGKKLPQSMVEKTRKRMLGNKNCLGKKHTQKWKEKMSQIMRGDKTHLWKGGISTCPYSYTWNNNLRSIIRERDRYCCRICGLKQIKPKLHVHHIDYNKNNCDPKNLISLCHPCHAQTNFNRKDWINYFKNI